MLALRGIPRLNAGFRRPLRDSVGHSMWPTGAYFRGQMTSVSHLEGSGSAPGSVR